jgi:hypothetical protein
LAAINEVARAEGAPVAVRHVCVACAAAVQASGVGLYLLGDRGLCEPLYVSTAVSEQVAELQVMLGEGPGTDALGREYPVLVPALGSAASALRWPAFAPAALAVGVSAVFAFPLVMGAMAVGALEIHRDQEGLPGRSCPAIRGFPARPIPGRLRRARSARSGSAFLCEV